MIKKNLRLILLSLTSGGMFVVALLAFFATTAHAFPLSYFVSQTGGGSCSQAAPCSLSTGLAQAVLDGAKLYLAGGKYTGSGSAVITLTHSILLIGGWNGSTTFPPIVDPQAYPTILDGQSIRRVIYISQNITPTISGFVITHGWSPVSGGGIYSNGSSSLIANNIITDNRAAFYGGGIYLSNSTTTIIGNQVLSNSVQDGGGGIELNYSSKAVINNNIFSTNKSTYASAIETSHAQVTATDNLLKDNQGGDVWLSSGSGSTLLAYNNILVNNSGSGFNAFSDGKAVLLHNTLYHNKTAAYCAFSGMITATNNIIADHTGKSIECSLITGTHNLFWNNNTNPNLLNNPVQADPHLVNPSGGDYHLGGGSAAVDAGVNAGVTTDYDSNPRPIGTGYDIGAYERWMYVYLPLVMR
jgi:hypothetical protein